MSVQHLRIAHGKNYVKKCHLNFNNTVLILVKDHPKIKPTMAFQYLSEQPGSTKKENNPVN